MLDSQRRIFVELSKVIMRDVGVYSPYEDRIEEIANAMALLFTGEITRAAFTKFIQSRDYYSNYEFTSTHLDGLLSEARKYGGTFR